MNITALKAAVRTRDGHRCTECGLADLEHRRVCGKALEVHRLKPGTPYSMEGCRTLCGACHAKQPRSPSGTSDRTTIALSRADVAKALGLHVGPDVSLTRLVLSLVTSATPEAKSEALRSALWRVTRDDEPPTQTVRIAADLAAKARFICAHSTSPDGSRLTVSAYLASILRAPLTRDYNDAVARLLREHEAKTGGAP
jgi:hypothetical protein